jgi:hypothetical protein
VSQKYDVLNKKNALVGVEFQIHIPQSLERLMDMGKMFFPCSVVDIKIIHKKIEKLL